jgi:hypothetical protein
VNTAGGSLCLLHVCIDSFRVFSEYVLLISANSETVLCIARNPKFAIPQNAPHIIRYSLGILHRLLIPAYSPNAKKWWGILRNKFTLSTIPGALKGQCFIKIKWGVKEKKYWPYDENFTSFKKLLSAYMENKHNGEKWRIIEHISVNNGPTWKKTVDSFFQLCWSKPKNHFALLTA